MDMFSAFNEVKHELESAKKKFPTFPSDPIHAAAVVAEECGELQRAALQYSYEGGNKEEMRKEAVQTGAMALRFLLHLDKTKIKKSEQDLTE